MRIQYVCHYQSLTGFGRAARDYAAALAAHAPGAQIEIIDWKSFPGHPDAGKAAVSPEPRYRDLDRLVRPWPRPGDPPPDLVLAHGQPQLLTERPVQEALAGSLGGKLAMCVAMTTWETSRMPDDLVAGLAWYSAVIVPSHASADALDPHGRPFGHEPPEVHIVPHCFDPSFWPKESYGQPRTAAGTTRFYTHGAWSERKNHLAVLRAFLHAFHDQEDVSLLIASQGADHHAIRSTIARSGLRSGIPEVIVHDQPLPEQDLIEMHLASDVFVTATRGEGWGYPIFEAAILGKPMIVPIAALYGYADFLMIEDEKRDHEWNYTRMLRVPAVNTPCFAGPNQVIFDAQGRAVGEKVSLVQGMDCRQTWRDPDVMEIAERMAYARRCRIDGRLRVDPTDRQVLEAEFGYEPVAQTLYQTLQEIAQS